MLAPYHKLNDLSMLLSSNHSSKYSFFVRFVCVLLLCLCCLGSSLMDPVRFLAVDCDVPHCLGMRMSIYI